MKKMHKIYQTQISIKKIFIIKIANFIIITFIPIFNLLIIKKPVY